MGAILTRRVQCTEFEDGVRQEERAKFEEDASNNDDLEKRARPWHHQFCREVGRRTWRQRSCGSIDREKEEGAMWRSC